MVSATSAKTGRPARRRRRPVCRTELLWAGSVEIPAIERVIGTGCVVANDPAQRLATAGAQRGLDVGLLADPRGDERTAGVEGVHTTAVLNPLPRDAVENVEVPIRTTVSRLAERRRHVPLAE